ncbi:hypothetical protein Tco_1512002, partial [Tanacetum coccineum]
MVFNPQEIHHDYANVQSPVAVADGPTIMSSSRLRVLRRVSRKTKAAKANRKTLK